MHQPEDEEGGSEATNDLFGDSKKEKQVSKASPKTTETFGGMKKGFLVFGDQKTSLGTHTQKKTYVQDVTEDIEFQMLGEGDEEENCGSAWETCTKYPGHVGFIPLSDFSMQHLPKKYQTQEIELFIKFKIDLTVRLRVKTSPGRPKDGQFAKGQVLTGTGYVLNSQLIDKDCICKDCKTRGIKGRKWWAICINSAAHCVYDEFEANNTKVDFFYDSEQSRRKGEMKTVSGMRMLGARRTGDTCTMECATHDDDLGKYLLKSLEQLSHLQDVMSFSNPSPQPYTSDNKFMLCVSHPHGKPKQITIGELKQECDISYKDPLNFFNDLNHTIMTGVHRKLYLYETRVCPGSSGAALYCLDELLSGDAGKILSLSHCTHRGVHLATGLNKGTADKCRSLEQHRRFNAQLGIKSAKDYWKYLREQVNNGPAWLD